MPSVGYVAAALGIGIAITFALRALPFALGSAIKNSEWMADLGRWMPLGAVVVLAVHQVATIDYGSVSSAAPYLAGLAATIAAHLWRRNVALSIVAGTGVCVALSAIL
ncbi:AzlD domain-containing protein [Tsukamurella sp. 8F]|uniref:branched-chain amino acid transporter permease n=1 Tax=unclassified Tsukamurella TaxID=2633480 RepID=UPI0023B96C19|nr:MULTISPECIES: AzlD domain-containing protein [unclassified Tsukamurella]MDF0532493.1 AzlD domain-containing protein [Tsukamurella sp. 8J]MDF0589164.1 AzlD domain-containing protein [Tsukamurella sp. 8F]